MYLQEFKIYLIGGHMLKAAEDVTIPAEHLSVQECQT